MYRYVALTTLLFGCFASLGCKREVTPTLKVTPVSYARYITSSEPIGAVEVLSFKEHAKDGEPVTVVGRVGGGIKPWIDGRAAFVLVDSEAPMPCEDEQCKECEREVAESSTVVKFLDAGGKTLAIDAREVLGIQEEDIVVIQGVAKRDGEGNVTLNGTSLFVKGHVVE